MLIYVEETSLDGLFPEKILIDIYLSSFNQLDYIHVRKRELDGSISDKARRSCDRDRIISFYSCLASSNANLNCL